MSAIMTHRKIMFDPFSPRAEDIHIRDIAHALSLLCRANGHFPHFYSVGQHSVLCMKEAEARGYSRRVQLGCLIHDASEAYLSDVTRPIKPLLPAYLEVEHALQGMIYDKWITPTLTEEEQAQIREIDDAILHYEFLEMMGHPIYDPAPHLASAPNFDFVMFDEIERAFLRAFSRLTVENSSVSVGVDWGGGKWIAVELENKIASWRVFDDINRLCLHYEQLPHVLIDAPVGLPENEEQALQRPDRAAREYLKVPARRSAVFPVPFRQLVYETDKQVIWNMSRELGAKITPQSIALFPILRQIDVFLSEHPSWKERLVESHPECAFQALNGNVGLMYSKHCEAGASERLEILSRFVENTEDLWNRTPRKWREDVLDALALAVTASRDFVSVSPSVSPDSKGLPMRIVIAP